MFFKAICWDKMYTSTNVWTVLFLIHCICDILHTKVNGKPSVSKEANQWIKQLNLNTVKPQ